MSVGMADALDFLSLNGTAAQADDAQDRSDSHSPSAPALEWDCSADSGESAWTSVCGERKLASEQVPRLTSGMSRITEDALKMC